MTQIFIPTALRGFTGGHAAVGVQGSTVGEALADLVRTHPALAPHLYDAGGTLRSFVNIYLNDEDIRHRERTATPLADGDEISIVPAIAGGAPERGNGTESAAPPALPELGREEIARYSRHLLLPEVGMEGQRKLKAASVLLVGTGGLGSPLGLYLAAAGIGRLGLVDFDVVDASNLQRQILHGTKDVGRSKLASARERIADINPHVVLDTYETRLEAGNALEILAPYDIIIDGTDNFPTRYLVNDACVLLRKPNVYGSIFRFEGQASVFHPAAGGPCYRCLYPEPPPPGLVPSCAEGGVLGVLPGIIGTIQATEAIKLILGAGETLLGRLMLFDALGMRFRELKLRRNPACPLCGEHPVIHELIDYEAFCGLPPEGTAAGTGGEIAAEQLRAELDAGRQITILDVREPHEWQISNLSTHGAKLIPLAQLPARLAELDPGADIVVHCKLGGRSAKACETLRQAGFPRVRNLQGGIAAWAERVDPSMAQY